MTGVWARLPLRVKLIATLLLLVAVALVGSGFAATATLRSYLVGRVDQQLADVARHADTGVTAGPLVRGPGGDADGDHADNGRLPTVFVVEVIDARGSVVYGPASPFSGTQSLPKIPTLTGLSGAQYFTTGAVSGGQQWRVYAEPVSLTTGGTGTLFVAQPTSDVEGTVGRLTLLLVVIGACAVVLVAAIGYLIVRASLRPLQRVEDTAAAIAAGDLSRRVSPGDPRTEVGQLAAALNTMLGEIETAFAERAASEEAARRSEHRMRRFVADASHELRTPLTSIRGFAELYRQGAIADDAELRRLMRRIEDEAKRMGLLVEDLLMLARVDQQRPLAADPVDLLALAADAVGDAKAVDPSRPITLDVGPTDPPPIVTGDEPRLRQVIGNLVANALQHTPPGTPIRVRVETDPGQVTVAVADQGPGLNEEDAGRVFERFYRAEQSRNRADGGTGLGLAIVSALVDRHGGTVDVQTRPGQGACFRVRIPLAAVRETLPAHS